MATTASVAFYDNSRDRAGSRFRPLGRSRIAICRLSMLVYHGNSALYSLHGCMSTYAVVQVPVEHSTRSPFETGRQSPRTRNLPRLAALATRYRIRLCLVLSLGI